MPNTEKNIDLKNEHDYKLVYYFMRQYSILIIQRGILLFLIPLLDLYFWEKYRSCVMNGTVKLNINLYVINDTIKLTMNLIDYLLISGFVETIYILLIIILYYTSSSFLISENVIKIQKIFKVLTFIWNIIGGVFFMNLIDTNDCSENIYCYIFITLIIKLFLIFSLLMN